MHLLKKKKEQESPVNHKDNLTIGSKSFNEDSSIKLSAIQHSDGVYLHVPCQLDLVHSPPFSFIDVGATAVTRRGGRHVAAEFAVSRSPVHH